MAKRNRSPQSSSDSTIKNQGKKHTFINPNEKLLAVILWPALTLTYPFAASFNLALDNQQSGNLY